MRKYEKFVQVYMYMHACIVRLPILLATYFERAYSYDQIVYINIITIIWLLLQQQQQKKKLR